MAALDTSLATRRSSDLSKHSAEVFAEAEDHPVTVTRRDGEPLVLMSQREAESRSRLLEFAAQLITVALDDGGPLAERMAKAMFPLPEQEPLRELVMLRQRRTPKAVYLALLKSLSRWSVADRLA